MNKTIIFLLPILVLFVACSDDETTTPKTNSDESGLTGDHVWKQQTDTIDRAKQVEGLIQDAADKQRQAIGEQAE